MNARALSAAEFEMAQDAEISTREHHEDWLYFHLSVAREARRVMDGRKSWDGDYIAKHQEREAALIAAAKHYRALINMGRRMSGLLAEMALCEGLKP